MVHPSIDACWSSVSRAGGPVRVLPDGCIDLLFAGGRLFTSRLVLEAETVELPAGTWAVGVRFAPGHAGAALPLMASSCLGHSFAATEVDASFAELEHRLQDCSEPTDALRLLEDAVLRRLRRALPKRQPPEHVGWAITQLPLRAVHDVAAELRVSERTLARGVEQWTGLTPKQLARVRRLQQVVRGLRAGASLVDLALDAGFADQPHLTREVRRLTGLTPAGLRRDLED